LAHRIVVATADVEGEEKVGEEEQARDEQALQVEVEEEQAAV